MTATKPSRDYRAWILFLVALVPIGGVLGGGVWLWNSRSAMIEETQLLEVTVTTNEQIWVTATAILRAHASVHAAALPGATAETMAVAEADRVAALEVIQEAEITLSHVLGSGDVEVEDLVESSLGLLYSLFDGAIVGDPVSQALDGAADFVRDSGASISLRGPDESGITSALQEAMTSTIDYYNEFDRYRSSILSAVEAENLFALRQLSNPPVTVSSAWSDLVEIRLFGASTYDLDWTASPGLLNNNLLIDRTEPVSEILQGFTLDRSLSPEEWGDMIGQIRELDIALSTDAVVASDALRTAIDGEVASLAAERRLGLIASALMAFFGVALARLTSSEISQRKRAMNWLAEKVERDPTTSAWNRRRLEAVLPAMLSDAHKAGEIVVLAYLDIDSFKAVNDVWGHRVGDEVLRTVTDRLLGFCHDGVDFDLCRFGGDEFVVYAKSSPRSYAWLKRLGEAMLAGVSEPMQFEGRQHKIAMSAGIATSTSESTIDSLLLEADSSLIMAKRKRGTAVVYDRDLSRTGELVQALPDALTESEVKAHIQPVIDVSEGEVLNVEALARWQRPSGEQVPPGIFVPLAESYGLAEELTVTVLRSVQEMLNSKDTPAKVRIWVNVSPRELDVGNFANRFVQKLHELGVDPTRIGMEITESAAVRDPLKLRNQLIDLRRHGISIAIDDFGSGYSPLGYLRMLPVDTVKIDRSLIAHIDTDIANQHIVIGIIGLVTELGMSVTAEGVERTEEQAWLAGAGIQRMQGYLFGRPDVHSGMDWTSRDKLVPA